MFHETYSKLIFESLFALVKINFIAFCENMNYSFHFKTENFSHCTSLVKWVKEKFHGIFFFISQIILVLKSLKLYGNSHITVIIQIISHVLAYTNSCVNPVLYAFLSDNFRKAFRKVSKIFYSISICSVRFV